MLAYDDLRTGFRPFFRRARAARLASPAMHLTDIGEPAAFPTALPLATLAPTGDARLLRRLRHVVRRRVKVELDGLVQASSAFPFAPPLAFRSSRRLLSPPGL